MINDNPLNDESSNFLHKKRNREPQSNEEKLKMAREKALSIPPHQQQELFRACSNHFNSNFKSVLFDYTEISQYERDLNYQGANSYDILIILDDFQSNDCNTFNSVIEAVVNSIQEKLPFFMARLGLIGRVITSKGEVNLSLSFQELICGNELSKRIKSLFNSDMIEEDLSFSELLSRAVQMNWESKAKAIFLLHDASEGKKEELSLATIKESLNGLAQKGIELHCLLMNSMKSCEVFEQMREAYLRASQIIQSCSINEVGMDKEKEIFRVVVKRSICLMRYSLYTKDYIEELLRQFKLDTYDYINEKYPVNNSLTLLEQIDSLGLNENDIKRVRLMTEKLSSLPNKTAIQQKEDLSIEKEPNSKEIEFNEEECFQDEEEHLHQGEDPNSPQSKDNDGLSLVHDFSNRNVIRSKAKAFLFDVAFSSIRNCICHSIKCLSYPFSQHIDWLNPALQHNQTDSVIKISENVYSDDTTYSIAAYDYHLNLKFKVSTPVEIARADYNLEHFLKQMTANAVCEEIVIQFNLRYFRLFPQQQSPIQFTRCFLYEMNDFNAMYLFADQLPLNLEGDSKGVQLDLDLKEALCHFSYQITKGTCLITDIEDCNGVITGKRLIKISDGVDYHKVIQFFLLHCCNELCFKLKLIHPKDSKELESSFFECTIISKEGPSVCSLCSGIYDNNEDSVYCANCILKNGSSLRRATCQSCHAVFEYSNHYYTQLTLPRPLKCGECLIIEDN